MFAWLIQPDAYEKCVLDYNTLVISKSEDLIGFTIISKDKNKRSSLFYFARY